ncbi:MAG: DNA (cytosine-5-)-methyltransferase [Planctomycetota bacterium]
MNVAGLFAGIGGFELGLTRANHHTRLLCEIDPGALAVLGSRFPDVPEIVPDVTKMEKMPRDVDLVVAGFPCINLSLAGYKQGIDGPDSSLVRHVFRMLERRRVPNVVLENVPFMLHLSKGEGMLVILEEFERLGYRWAYRVVDALSFGLPQRRERVIFFASRELDPRGVLLADNHATPPLAKVGKPPATGFYWTEGIRGMGWAEEALPTLKGGSTVGIPSPPAIWVKGKGIFLPDIRDAERMQGFEVDWTKPAESRSRASHRWKLVGNAVSTRVSEWIGKRLADPGEYDEALDGPFDSTKTLPKSAWGDGKRRFCAARITRWPASIRRKPLLDWLQFEPKELSIKAARGLTERTSRSKLNFHPGFLEDLARYLERKQDEALAS